MHPEIELYITEKFIRPSKVLSVCMKVQKQLGRTFLIRKEHAGNEVCLLLEAEKGHVEDWLLGESRETG